MLSVAGTHSTVSVDSDTNVDDSQRERFEEMEETDLTWFNTVNG